MASTTASTSKKPVQTFRLRGVTASVFANEVKKSGKEYLFHKVRLTRTYKDGDDFKRTSGLDRDDLPIAAHLLDKAWKYILDLESGATAA